MTLGRFRNGATAPRLVRVRRAHVESLEFRTLFSAGALDTSWGDPLNAGHAFADFGHTSDTANGVATQTVNGNTKIVTAGVAKIPGVNSDPDQFFVAVSRHNADGSIDTSFNGGAVRTQFGGNASQGFAVAVDNLNRIVVLGTGTLVDENDVGHTALGLARYLPNGTLDTSFGTGGTALLDLSDPQTHERIDSFSDLSLAIDATNRVVIGATSSTADSTNMYVVRATESGFADGSFGQSGGVARTGTDLANEFAGGLAIDAAGNIYQAGFSSTEINETSNYVGNLVVVRYSPNGSTGIQGFGDNGRYDGIPVAMDGVRSAFLDADGSFVVGGVIRVSDPGGFDNNILELVRVAADGHTATTAVTTLVNTDSFFRMAPQRDGKIVVVSDDSDANFGPTHYVVARFNGDLSADTSFDGNDAAPGDHVYTSPDVSIVQGVVIDATDGIIVAASAFRSATASDDFFLSRHDADVDSSGGGSGGGVVGNANAGGVDKPDDPDVHHYYSVAEGHTVTLHGTGSAVLQGGSGLNGYLANQHRVLGGGSDGGGTEQQDVVFSWLYNGTTIPGADLDVTGVDDGTVQARFQVALASAPSVVIAFSDATIEVTNVAPRDAAINAPAAPKEGQSITLGGSAVDVPADVLAYSWTVTTPGGQTLTGSGPTFAFTPADNGAYTVNLRVEDDDHGVDDAPQVTLNVGNVAPEVTLGGIPTQADEGTALTFSSQVDDVDADANPSYLWTVTRGTTSLATGATPSFAFTPNDNGSYQISLTVTDKDGSATTESQTFTVNNVAPTATVSGDTVGVRGQKRTLNLGAADPGAADVVAGFTFTINWADGSPAETIPTGTTTATHVYAQNGVYQAVITATDQDHAASTPLTVAMTTLTAALQDGVLNVSGGTGPDKIRLSQSGGVIALGVSDAGNGASEFVQNYTGVTRVVVHGQAGDDSIDATSLTVPVEMYGGAGADKLIGGAAADILVGGDGDDKLAGNGGRDLLIGGFGADKISGNEDDDIIIGGISAYDDASVLALRAISAEWTSSRSYAQRAANVNGSSPTPVRNNDSYFLTANVTTFDDGAVDTLAGDVGSDLFFANVDASAKDKIADATTAEFVFDINPQ